MKKGYMDVSDDKLKTELKAFTSSFVKWSAEKETPCDIHVRQGPNRILFVQIRGWGFGQPAAGPTALYAAGVINSYCAFN